MKKENAELTQSKNCKKLQYLKGAKSKRWYNQNIGAQKKEDHISNVHISKESCQIIHLERLRQFLDCPEYCSFIF